MKHLAVALIFITLVAADFGADLWMNGTKDNKGWDTTVTFGGALTIIWFFHHRDRS